jgi:hypothetical protein
MKMNNPLLVAALLVSGLAGPAFAAQSQPSVGTSTEAPRLHNQAVLQVQTLQSVQSERRADGVTFEVSGENGVELNRRDAERFAAAISRQLPNDISTYRINEIARVIERAGNSTFPNKASKPNLYIKFSWYGWTITIRY